MGPSEVRTSFLGEFLHEVDSEEGLTIRFEGSVTVDNGQAEELVAVVDLKPSGGGWSYENVSLYQSVDQACSISMEFEVSLLNEAGEEASSVYYPSVALEASSDFYEVMEPWDGCELTIDYLWQDYCPNR